MAWPVSTPSLATRSALRRIDQAERDHAFSLPFIPLYHMLDGIRQTERYRRLIDRIGVVPP